MKVQSVRAAGFGPLDQEDLVLAPGLTVVWGPNEAGKSAWHAALAVALTGVRRGRGRRNRDDALFAERHQPWDGRDWRLEAVVGLDDGRILDVRWDLSTRVGTASDARGRDVTGQFLTDGGLDLAQAVGLDRDSFAVTACVRQAELLAVLENPAVLQEFLQRAAATQGKDATAAAALAAIDEYLRAHVGMARSNSRKPLQAAIDGLRRAEAHAEEAHRLHDERLDIAAAAERAAQATERTRGALLITKATLVARECRDAALQVAGEAEDHERLETDITNLTASLQQFDHRVELAEASLDVVRTNARLQDEREKALELDNLAAEAVRAAGVATEAATAVRSAEAAKARLAANDVAITLARAQELAERYPAPPATPVRDDELAQQAASALRGWKERPESPLLTGPTSDELAVRIAGLPDEPVGDVEVRSEVAGAESQWKDASGRLALHDEVRPAAPLISLDAEAELRVLSEVLSEPAPTCSRSARIFTANPRLNPKGKAVGALGALLVVAGTALLLLGSTVLGAVIAVAGVLAAVFGLLTWVPVQADASRPLPEPEVRPRATHRDGRPDEAALRVAELGLPVDGQAVRTAADNAAARQTLSRWEERHAALAKAADTAAQELRAVLDAAGGPTTPDLGADVISYRTDCEARRRQAAVAAQRTALEQQLADRLTAERMAAEGERLGRTAKQAILAAAEHCGVVSDDVETAVDAVESWLEERPRRLEATQLARDEHRELTDLLGGRTIEEFAAESARMEREALETVGPLTLPADQELSQLARSMPGLVEQHRKLLATAAGLEAQVKERGRLMLDVEGAEQAAQQASERLASLRAAHPSLESGSIIDEDERAAEERLAALVDQRQRCRDELTRLRGQLEEHARRPVGDRAAADQHEADAEATLEDLRRRYPEGAEEVDGLAADTAELLVELISELEADLQVRSDQASELKGQLEERSRQAPDVAAAEEAVEEARGELERVRRLERTLQRTTRFLGEAQERVHNDIAPRLAESAQRWLPTVFGTRYQRIRIDPATLEVRVPDDGGELRKATLLSYGTAEQLYLLLRIALVEELTGAARETCPIILDDITAHFDDVRTAGALALLHEVSTQRQVVVFTQETRVREWASKTLGAQDALVELAGPGSRPSRPALAVVGHRP